MSTMTERELTVDVKEREGFRMPRPSERFFAMQDLIQKRDDESRMRMELQRARLMEPVRPVDRLVADGGSQGDFNAEVHQQLLNRMATADQVANRPLREQRPWSQESGIRLEEETPVDVMSQQWWLTEARRQMESLEETPTVYGEKVKWSKNFRLPQEARAQLRKLRKDKNKKDSEDNQQDIYFGGDSRNGLQWMPKEVAHKEIELQIGPPGSPPEKMTFIDYLENEMDARKAFHDAYWNWKQSLKKGGAGYFTSMGENSDMTSEEMMMMMSLAGDSGMPHKLGDLGDKAYKAWVKVGRNQVVDPRVNGGKPLRNVFALGSNSSSINLVTDWLTNYVMMDDYNGEKITDKEAKKAVEIGLRWASILGDADESERFGQYQRGRYSITVDEDYLEVGSKIDWYRNADDGTPYRSTLGAVVGKSEAPVRGQSRDVAVEWISSAAGDGSLSSERARMMSYENFRKQRVMGGRGSHVGNEYANRPGYWDLYPNRLIMPIVDSVGIVDESDPNRNLRTLRYLYFDKGKKMREVDLRDMKISVPMDDGSAKELNSIHQLFQLRTGWAAMTFRDLNTPGMGDRYQLDKATSVYTNLKYNVTEELVADIQGIDINKAYNDPKQMKYLQGEVKKMQQRMMLTYLEGMADIALTEQQIGRQTKSSEIVGIYETEYSLGLISLAEFRDKTLEARRGFKRIKIKGVPIL